MTGKSLPLPSLVTGKGPGPVCERAGRECGSTDRDLKPKRLLKKALPFAVLKRGCELAEKAQA